MNSVAGMHAEAARCFRWACEAGDPLDRTIFISLRQAWVALAHQVEQRAMEGQRLVLPADTVSSAPRSTAKSRSSRAKRHKAEAKRRSPSRPRRKKLAA